MPQDTTSQQSTFVSRYVAATRTLLRARADLRELHRQGDRLGAALGAAAGVPGGTPAWVQWLGDPAFAGDNSHATRAALAGARALLDALEVSLVTPPGQGLPPADAALDAVAGVIV